MKITKTFINAVAKDPVKTLSPLSDSDIASVIQYANYHYYTLGTAVMTDDVYDICLEILEKRNPEHPILKHVGAVVQDDDRKEKLPFWMGSMDKIKGDTAALAAYKNRFPGRYMISDKLDGNSALLYRTSDGQFKLYSRGDGIYGQNISHILPFIRGIPDLSKTQLKSLATLAVRGELIMTKKDFESVADQGANARNMVAGLANAKLPDLDLLKRVGFVAYAVIDPVKDQVSQYDFLTKLGFLTTHHNLITDANMTVDELSRYLIQRRKDSPYEIDGIIVHHAAAHPLEPGKNPTYAFAFKTVLTQETAEVIVTHIEWNISKDGFMKPTVIFKAVRLAGVSIQRATGFNADFIKTHKLGPGSRIVITRSGDVIPHILQVLTPSASGQPQMPDVKYKWNESKVDIILDEENEDFDFKLIENFFSKLNIKGISTGTVRRIFDAGFKSIRDIVAMTSDDMESIDGLPRKDILHALIQMRLDNMDCITLMEASNAFGRGFGERKLKAITKAIPRVVYDSKYVPTVADLIQIDGVSEITANKFIEGLANYKMFIKDTKLCCWDKTIKTTPTLANENSVAKKAKLMRFENQHIVFTGFRNKEWQDIIEAEGGHVATAVSKKTTLVVAKDPSLTSGKLASARANGIPVIGIDEFQTKIT
jgi:DNA ligase (NAD+)